MSRRDETPSKTVITPAKAKARAARERRLAEALRENLRRRKDQSRDRAVDPGKEPTRGDKEK